MTKAPSLKNLTDRQYGRPKEAQHLVLIIPKFNNKQRLKKLVCQLETIGSPVQLHGTWIHRACGYTRGLKHVAGVEIAHIPALRTIFDLVWQNDITRHLLLMQT